MGYEELVAGWLRKHGKTQKHIDEDKKSANWKILLAWELRKQTSATNPWITQRLNMGHPSNVRRHINGIQTSRGEPLTRMEGKKGQPLMFGMDEGKETHLVV